MFQNVREADDGHFVNVDPNSPELNPTQSKVNLTHSNPPQLNLPQQRTQGGAAVAAHGLDFVNALDGGGNPYR